MKRTWSTLHIIALLIGGYILITEIFSNVEHIVHGTKSLYNPAVFIAIGVSIGTVFAFAMAMDSLEEWKKLSSWVNAIGLMIAFIFGTAFTLSTTLDRTATARDSQLNVVRMNDKELNFEIENLQKLSLQSARECGSGRGQKCEAISAEVKLVGIRVEAKKAALDSMGKRISSATGGLISAENATIFQPMFLPLAMFLMGTFMISYGMKGRLVQPEFKICLTGMAAKEDKARRFINEYKTTNGGLPSIIEVKKVADVSYPTAKLYLRKFARG